MQTQRVRTPRETVIGHSQECRTLHLGVHCADARRVAPGEPERVGAWFVPQRSLAPGTAYGGANMATDTQRNELSQLAEPLQELLWDAEAMHSVRDAVRGVGRGLLSLREVQWAWDRERERLVADALQSASLSNSERRPSNSDGCELEQHNDRTRVRTKAGKLKYEGRGLIDLWLPLTHHQRQRPSTPELFPRRGERDWDRQPLTDDEKLTLAAMLHDAEYGESGSQLVSPWAADVTLDTDPCPMFTCDWPRQQRLLDWWGKCLKLLCEGKVIGCEWPAFRIAAKWTED